MTDLITLTGPLVHHKSAVPLPEIEVVARPSRVVSRTSDGEDALKVPSTETDETGEFSLELVHSPGLRYYIEYHYGKRVVTPYVLDCDSWPAGSTMSITDLPPIAGVPPSAVEDLQAWVLARLAEGMSPEAIEQAVIDYLDANPVGIPAHNDTTGRDAADAHPMASITGLVAALAGKQAAGSYATAAQGSKADTAVQPESLHPVATSGQYGDLESLPDLGALPYRPDDWEPNPPDLSGLVATTDPRLSDARPPLAHDHVIGDTTGLADALNAKADTASLADVATSGAYSDLSGTPSIPSTPGDIGAVADNDVRLSDARTPTAHKASHATGGGDALTPADIGAATSGHTHAAPDLSGYVPTSRTVNGKALSGNITLNAADVGASTFSGDYDDLSGKPTLGTAAATAATDYATAAQGSKADAAIPSGLVDAKGDLIVATADDTVTRLPASTDGHVLTLDSAQAAGMKWAAPSGGGGGVETALYLSGTSGNGVSIPSTAALRPATELDVRLYIKAASTVAGGLIALGDSVANTDCSWTLYYSSSTLRLRTSPDGSPPIVQSCTVTGSVTGAWQWVRFTYTIGSPNDTARFYTSTDGISWTQQGADLTKATIGAFYATPNPLAVGTIPGVGSGSHFTGLIQAAQVRDGIDGTVVASWDGSWPHTRQRDPQGNIWTVNGTANAWEVI